MLLQRTWRMRKGKVQRFSNMVLELGTESINTEGINFRLPRERP